jgi:hypothetical protein
MTAAEIQALQVIAAVDTALLIIMSIQTWLDRKKTFPPPAGFAGSTWRA